MFLVLTSTHIFATMIWENIFARQKHRTLSAECRVQPGTSRRMLNRENVASVRKLGLLSDEKLRIRPGGR